MKKKLAVWLTHSLTHSLTLEFLLAPFNTIVNVSRYFFSILFLFINMRIKMYIFCVVYIFK